MKRNLSVLMLSFLCIGGQGVFAEEQKTVSTEDESSPDWQLTLKVKAAILGDDSLSPSNRFVSITTENGVVTITGKVTDRYQRNEIVKAAKKVPGVKGVEDKMTIED
jgi:osmotically-inducible protein OsmY